MEPILQVLVGKSLEQARIEVIEAHENAAHALANARYKQQREAMLVQTQRVEARQDRRNHETDRRNQQQRLCQGLTEAKEKRQIAKNMSKQFLKFFKRDTLTQLKDLGLLRSKKEFSMGYHMVPALYEQIKLEGFEDKDRNDVIQESIQVGMVGRAINHKKAIEAERLRREELKNEKLREEQEAARAKERRHERRKCLKEQKRIGELSEVLMLNVIPACEQREYTSALPIMDVRDYNPENPVGIYTFGGLVGELMVTLNSLQENLTSGGQNVGFELLAETIMKFLEELLVDGYPQGVCFIKLTQDPLTETEKEEESVEKQADLAAARIVDGSSLTTYGLKWLFKVSKSAGISAMLVEELIKALCMIHYHVPMETIPDPGDDEDVSAKIADQNEEIEKQNELMAKLKQYVKLVMPTGAEGEEEIKEPDYEEADEKCLVRIQNYRDPVPDVSDGANASLVKNQHATNTSAANAGAAVDEANSKMDTVSETESQKAQKQVEAFELEKLSQKIILLRPANEGYEGNVMIQHNEAVYMVRKQILEKAKTFLKEAKDLNVNYVLGMTQLKQ